MAKCKTCRTNIPDGSEYCKDCMDKGRAKSNESYLDSLLNSVKNTAPTTESIYKKKSSSNIETSINELDKTVEKDFQDEDIFKIDLDDMEEFDQFKFNEDLTDIDNEIVISDKELFGEDLSNIFSDEKIVGKKTKRPDISSFNADQHTPKDSKRPEDLVGTKELERPEELQEQEELERPKELQGQKKLEGQEILRAQEESEEQEELEEPEEIEESEQRKELDIHMRQQDAKKVRENVTEHIIEDEYIPEPGQNNSTNIETEYNTTSNNFSTNELNELNEEDNYDEDLNDLLNKLESLEDLPAKKAENEEIMPVKDEKSVPIVDNNPLDDKVISDDVESFKQEEEEDDFLSLLNQISADDPVADDVKAINDLMNGIPVEPVKGSNMPSDVGEVFSDALKAVSGLNDPNINETELLDKIPDKKSKKAKNKKIKKSNKDSSNLEEKPKKGFWKRLFGNVEDKNAKKKIANSKNSDNEENIALKEATKKSKPKKGKKGKATKDEDASQTGDNQGKDKSKQSKEDKKKEKKLKKQKSKEIIQVIDEIDEDVGRINRLGAVIVFIFFGLLALLICVGSNAVSYTLSIQHATNYFDDKKYTQAYNEVYGMDIKDKDIEIYDKIQTVMFVNKQLNSYNNYHAIGEYPKALDSLLKGLKRYDKYIELATMLGIKTDMDYVREQILAELKNEFKITEEDALKIISIDNMKEYSLKVYDVALENE
ncbi:MAG: hypothetical protein PHC34_13530 [Candidatus Gastranaerophilales bacterium]|nr:hypothetical protein [Candidatus Gastranaerophilales bacterium]